ncbi:MAG: class I SAM-dependent methyltransferase [Oscillochloris sp.]|nr:class I SAM-dependent methyltransferase [Oscillochloris sp.]
MIYSAYAPIYDAIDQGAFARQLTARILEHEPKPARALDLACGTGAATLVLAQTGCAVTGIDRSPEMLAIARANTFAAGVSASFVEADLRRLHRAPLPEDQFDLAVCLYDSLNYMRGDGDLELVLQNTARLLRRGGRLIFDLNTEYEFLAWDESDQVVYDDGTLLVYNRLTYEPSRRLAHGRIVWFQQNGQRWRRGEELHIERAWSDAEVLQAIDAAGLKLLDRRTPTYEAAPVAAPRLVYRCERRR